jgi:6-phosphogluconolactonase
VHDAPKPPPERVSLGLRGLRSTRAVLVLATGAGKREALARWRAGDDLPIARACAGLPVAVLLDEAANPV